mmetsp:Transcript_6784/g.12682  ORF Transcript_6784/g.12682 Transcript_6784/m.12682 type:complete len:116 (-) Transcript_6784:85-432(-)
MCSKQRVGSCSSTNLGDKFNGRSIRLLYFKAWGGTEAPTELSKFVEPYVHEETETPATVHALEPCASYGSCQARQVLGDPICSKLPQTCVRQNDSRVDLVEQVPAGQPRKRVASG